MRMFLIALAACMGCASSQPEYWIKRTGPEAKPAVAERLDGAYLWGGTLRTGNRAYFLSQDSLAAERDGLLRELLGSHPLAPTYIRDVYVQFVDRTYGKGASDDSKVFSVAYPDPVLELIYSECTVMVQRRESEETPLYEFWMEPVESRTEWTLLEFRETPKLSRAWFAFQAAAKRQAEPVRYDGEHSGPPVGIWMDHFNLAIPAK